MTYKYPFYDYWLDKTTEAAIYNVLKSPHSIKVAFCVAENVTLVFLAQPIGTKDKRVMLFTLYELNLKSSHLNNNLFISPLLPIKLILYASH